MTANANHPNTRGPEAHVARKSVNDNLFNSHQNYHINDRNEALRLETVETQLTKRERKLRSLQTQQTNSDDLLPGKR